MKRLITVAALAALTTGATQGQNEVDALRYSQSYHRGTARFMAMGGAFGALGGDLSTLATNPAGLAVYRRGEISISPAVHYSSVDATYSEGGMRNDSRYNFNLGNAGFAIHFPTSGDLGFKNFNVGFAYNRRNNFNRNIAISGQNAKSSMADRFVSEANGLGAPTTVNGELVLPNGASPLFEQLAWDTYLINWDPNANEYWSRITDDAQYGQNQTQTIEESGASGEYDFSFGTNYADRLYIGGTMGIHTFRFIRSSFHTEDGITPDIYLNSFSLLENLDSYGSGFNFKFGMIGRVIDSESFFLNLGGAVHTPTFFNISEEFFTEMTTSFSPGEPESDPPTSGETSRSERNLFDYRLQTPLRVTGSLAAVVAKVFIVSAEYELVDYSTARLRSNLYDFNMENQAVNEQLAQASNIRAGLEARLGMFALRGGFAHYGSPYASSQDRAAAEMTSLSAGLGINTGNFYFDMAFVQNRMTETHYLYDLPTNDARTRSSAELDNRSALVLATFGIRFGE